MPGNLRTSDTRSRLFDLFLIAVLVVYAVAAIVSYWQSPYLLALLLLPAPVALVARLGRPFIAVAAAGAVIGPLTEVACVFGGLWRYGQTGGLPFIPPWLFVIWACFPTALWLIVRSLLGKIPEPRPGTLPLALAGIAIEIVLFVALSENTLLVISAALLLAAVAVASRPEKSTVILMAAGSILGPVCEALPVAAGAWAYARQDIFGMPAWLPLAYALFAVLVAWGAQSFRQKVWQ
ncbi:MAG: hypothetical protein PHW87_04805 [Methanothrix sp.]|nr:hypothetical protein [Methanothrix sp.]